MIAEYRFEIGIALLFVWLGLRFFLRYRAKERRRLLEEQRDREEAATRGTLVEDDDLGA